jgi:hypothetical protein
VYILTWLENIAIIKCMARRTQLEFSLKPVTRWGGVRNGAGRKSSPRPRVWHRRRTAVFAYAPALVTLRARASVPSLRNASVVRELERSFRAGGDRQGFRLTHYSIQNDHLHLMVEAEGPRSLACGMKSLGARIARAVNRAFARRGPVLDGRYHHRSLATPREVRNALAYVLMNFRKHAAKQAGVSPLRLDPASSARWFEGWADPPGAALDRPAVAAPRTWLLRWGWRRHGLIPSDEVPGRSRR